MNDKRHLNPDTQIEDARIEVAQSVPIAEALSLAREQHADAVSFSDSQGQVWLAFCDDLSKMATMGLGELPVGSVAIPERSPLCHENRANMQATLDLAKRLSAFFPVYFVAALYELQSLIQKMGLKAYVIGGITRDLLLYQEKRLSVRDVDITVEGDALALADFLLANSRNFTLIEKFPEFGTAKISYKDDLMFDVASTRQEIYPHCGALPVVVNRGVPLVNDIVRRDFTVNALSFSVHHLGQVLDYANGLRDIELREIRVLHPISFFEDPSRILRALKFCARFDFSLPEETATLLQQFLQVGAFCYKGGGERIKQELKGFLRVEESPAKSKWLRYFMQHQCYRLFNMETSFSPSPALLERLTGIGPVLPELMDPLSPFVDADFVFDVYLCFLLRDMEPEDFQKTLARLGLTRNEREFVEQFRKLKDGVSERFSTLHEYSSPGAIYDLFHGLHLITVVACILELALAGGNRYKIVLEAFVKYKRKWEKTEVELDGNDLIGLGVPEGKVIGQLLDQLLHAKLAGQVPDRLEEVQYIQNQLAAHAERLAEFKAQQGREQPPEAEG
ncbi:poly(A) polymerase I [Microcystis phage MaAM05]|nr:poly(A) polymerase I [Microcystis phage MaAM05]